MIYRFGDIEMTDPTITIIGYGVYRDSLHIIVDVTDGINTIEELRLDKDGTANDRSDEAIHALAVELLKDYEV